VLLQAFEEDHDASLVRVLEDYMSHNDYLKLKNELIDFSNKLLAPANAYSSLAQAIEVFKEQGNLTETDVEFLQKINIEKDKHLVSIWNAYHVTKSYSDLIHSLKVFVELRTKGRRT